jgi:hypothetical protein
VVHAGSRSGWRGTLARELGSVLAGGARLSIRQDALALGLAGASLLGIGGLVAYVTLWLPSLPLLLPLHYNGLGSVDLIGPRTDLYKMPAIGGVVFLTNLALASRVHARERLAALTLLAASILVQSMLIVATINIVRLAFGD